MSKQVPVGEYYQSFDMATHAFVVAFPLVNTENGPRLGNEANLLSIWQGVAPRPDIIAAALRHTADALEAGDVEPIVGRMEPGRG